MSTMSICCHGHHLAVFAKELLPKVVILSVCVKGQEIKFSNEEITKADNTCMYWKMYPLYCDWTSTSTSR